MINKNYLSKVILIFFTLVTLNVMAQQGKWPTEVKDPNAGYLVISGWYKDSQVQKEYISKVGPITQKYGIVTAHFGVPGVNLKVLEGTWIPRPFALMQFKSEKAVKQFWTSPEYQKEVKPIREGQSALDVLKVGAAFGTKPTLDDKSALLVFFVDITDRDKLMKEYVPYAPDVVKSFGGKFLVSSAQWAMELLEGDYPAGSMVVLEFPTTKALRSFWNDKEYKKLSEIRKTTGKWSAIEITPFKGFN